MRGRNFLILLVLVGLFSPALASAATYYVNYSTGNDTTGDGTSGTPYKTFHKGYTVAAASGDTLNLTGTFDWSNSDETGDASGSGYTLSKSMTIQGQGVDTTYIQASSTENTASRSVFTVAASKTVTIKNLTIRYGYSTVTETGAGITNNGTLNLQLAKLSNNKCSVGATTFYCGAAIGLPNSANSTLNISTTTIANNNYDGKAYGSAGVYSGQSNTITIIASTFNHNHATSSDTTTFPFSYSAPSGAFGVYRFVTTIVTNSTFSGNTSNGYGGALQVYYPNSFKITNSTIANNNATKGGGGITFQSETDGYNLYLKNTIFANNASSTATADDIYVYSGSSGRTTDNGYNIIETSMGKTWSGTGNLTGDQASLNLDTSVADNSTGNGVQTLALSSGSVAIDAGNAAAASSVTPPGVDQRGGTRSGTIDIGAYEYGAGGISDVTAPSVSLTAPSAASTVGGSAVSLSASASDNIGLAGVTFYVDNTLQGSEDTTSTYGISWDSRATTSGSHSAFAVARDTSNNYATSSTVSFTVDNAGPVVSAVSVSTTTSTATVTWTTSEAASSQLYFGLTSSYGTSTGETNTSSRVTSHSRTLGGLLACTLYHYQASSSDAVANTGTSTDATLTTGGCTGSAPITSSEESGITTIAGGSLSEGNATVTVPTSFTSTSSSAVFQIHQLDNTSFTSSAGAPSGVSRVGTDAFRLAAFIDATTTLSSFTSSISVTLAYSASDITGLNESTLSIYRYDGSTWNALSSCSTNSGARTVTCSTTNFSDFALFGSAAAASSGSGSSGGNGPIFSGSVATLKGNFVIPVYASSSPSTQEPDTAQHATTTPVMVSASSVFPRNLYRGTKGEDVRALQVLLNSRGFTIATAGNGSPGQETDTFGPRTRAALIKFQEAHDITPAVGFFGSITRALATELWSNK